MAAARFSIIFILFQFCIFSNGLVLDKYFNRQEFLNFYKTLTQTQGIYNNIFLINKLFEGLDSQLNITEICRQDLLTFRKFSVNSTELWPMMMLDASGNYQSGMFRGNLAHLGDWHECHSIRSDYLSPAVCAVRVNLPDSHLQTSSNIYHNTPIVFNLCLVSTCSEGDLLTALMPWFSSRNITLNVYCYPKKESSNLLIVVIVTSMIILLVGSSSYDEWKSRTNQKVGLNLWNIFSMRRNFSQLITSPSSISSSGTLSALYGLRFLSQLTIIMYHIHLYNMSLNKSLSNKFDVTEVLESWRRSHYIALTLSVDTFLVMSGFLISYTSINNPNKYRNIGLYYLQRYIRLTPSLLAMILFYVLCGDKVFYGPQSGSRTREVNACRKYWWTNLLYINNYHSYIMEMCLNMSWYLAVDWQLYLLSPILLFLVSTFRNKRIIHAIFAALFTIAIIIPSIQTFLLSLPADEIFVVSELDHYKYITRFYTATETRFGPWIIGFFVGTLIKIEDMKTLCFNKYFQWACWIISSIIMTLCFNWSVTTFELEDRNLYVNAAFNSLKRNMWGISMGWLIFTCATGNAGIINRFLSWKVFEPLGKLSYGAYLVQLTVLYFILFDGNIPTNYSPMKEVADFISGVTLSYLAALVMYLTVEAPACNLAKLYLSGSNKRKKPTDKTKTLTSNEESASNSNKQS